MENLGIKQGIAQIVEMIARDLATTEQVLKAFVITVARKATRSSFARKRSETTTTEIKINRQIYL